MKRLCIFFVIFILILAFLLIFQLGSNAELQKNYVKLKEQVSTLKETAPKHLGEIDLDDGIIYVSCNDLIYESTKSKVSEGIVWDILPEYTSLSLPYFFDNFYAASFGIALKFSSYSSGRFEVTFKETTIWVEPSATVFCVSEDGTRIEGDELVNTLLQHNY